MERDDGFALVDSPPSEDEESVQPPRHVKRKRRVAADESGTSSEDAAKRRRRSKRTLRSSSAAQEDAAQQPKPHEEDEEDRDIDTDTEIEQQQQQAPKPPQIKSSMAVVEERAAQVVPLARRLAKEESVAQGTLPARLFVQATLGLQDDSDLLNEWPKLLELCGELVDAAGHVKRSDAIDLLRALAKYSESRKGLRYLLHLELTKPERQWHKKALALVDAQLTRTKAGGGGDIARASPSPAAVEPPPPAQPSGTATTTPLPPTRQASAPAARSESVTKARTADGPADSPAITNLRSRSARVPPGPQQTSHRAISAAPLPRSHASTPSASLQPETTPPAPPPRPLPSATVTSPLPIKPSASPIAIVPAPRPVTSTAESASSPRWVPLFGVGVSTQEMSSNGQAVLLPLPTRLYSFEGDASSLAFVRTAAAYAKPLHNDLTWRFSREALRAVRLIMTPDPTLDPGLISAACLLMPLFRPQGGASVEDLAIRHCVGLGVALGTAMTDLNRQRLEQLGWMSRRKFSSTTAGAAPNAATSTAFQIFAEAFAMASHLLRVQPNTSQRNGAEVGADAAPKSTFHNSQAAALYSILELTSSLAKIFNEDPIP